MRPSPAKLSPVWARAGGVVVTPIHSDFEREKQLAAEASARLVEDGMTVGLGTGSTVAYLLPALAARGLRIRCVATSPATADTARKLGMDVRDFSGLEAPNRLDVAIDGADQVDPAGW